jgi:DNA oxidative demethylase
MLHLTNALMHDLFQLIEPLGPSREMMAEGAVLLRRAALPFGDRLLVA